MLLQVVNYFLKAPRRVNKTHTNIEHISHEAHLQPLHCDLLPAGGSCSLFVSPPLLELCFGRFSFGKERAAMVMMVMKMCGACTYEHTKAANQQFELFVLEGVKGFPHKQG
jgi:hypothetical protein